MTVLRKKRALRRILSLQDFELAASRHLPRPVFAYVSGGSEEGITLRENRAIFDEFRLVPRVLVDVSKRSHAARLFGKAYSAPFGIAPMGISALSAYRGDLVQAVAAARLGIPAILSGSSLIRLEDVARAAPGTWFQAYIPPTPERRSALVERVAKAGYETLVITVDTAVVASRENNVRAGFHTPLKPSASLLWQGGSHPSWSIGTFFRTIVRHGIPHFENNEAVRGVPIIARSVARDISGRDTLSWTALADIRRRWKGRLVVKGLLHPSDVKLAVESGADGVILSNHGGRQLDGAPSPMRMLRAAVATAGDLPVMIDSGFRRGTDIIKALALGAAFVFIGRPFNYAAAIAGEEGVEHAYRLLSIELLNDLALLGVGSIAELHPDHVLPLHRRTEADAFSP